MRNPSQLFVPIAYLVIGYSIGVAGGLTSILLYVSVIQTWKLYLSLSIMGGTLLVLGIIILVHYLYWKATSGKPVLEFYNE